MTLREFQRIAGFRKRAGAALHRVHAFVHNEIVRTVRRTGNVQSCICLSGPRCPSEGNLGTTRIIPHYPVRLARALGLPSTLYAIHLYPDKLAQDAFFFPTFDPGFRPSAEEHRDFVNGLVQIDLHERLHVFLTEETHSVEDETEGGIEFLETKLAASLFPEYRSSGPHPWHSERCPRCRRGSEGAAGEPALQDPRPRSLSMSGSAVM